MTKIRTPKTAGTETKPLDLSIRKDRAQRFRFRFGTGVGEAAARVREIQRAVLNGLLDNESDLSRTIGFLILFDGICHLDDLAGSLANLRNAYRFEGQPVLDWLGKDGRQHRRLLSKLTTRTQPWLGVPPSHDDIHAALSRLTTLIYSENARPPVKLLQDMCAYLSEIMPGALFADVTHLAPITALPRSALARKETLRRLVADHQSVPMSGAAAIGAAIDHAMQSTHRKGGVSMVERIIAICLEHSRNNDARDRQNMLKALIAESDRVGQTDGVSALLLAWVIDFVESGGLKERHPRPQTIEKYVRNTLRELHEHLGGLDIFSLPAERFGEIYTQILAHASPGNRTHCLTGLKTWHTFLVECFDAPRLESGLDAEEGPAIPNANVIWPHEIDLLLQWLASSSINERLKEQVDVCIRLTANIRLRAKELFFLRRYNLRRTRDGLEVEVAPLANTGSLKSESARRVQVLHDPESVRRLLAWDHRRQNEGALWNDYLFGDPYHPERAYRIGSTYLLINRLLKAVTGDPSVSLHTLSHTWSSHAVLDALVTPVEIDVPPLEQVATLAGHRSAQTTLTHYFHFPAEAIRFFLDRELAQLKITSELAQRWSGVSATTLRKRASDRRVPAQKVYWQAIFDAELPLPVPLAESGIALESPEVPDFLSGRSALNREAVLQAIADRFAGETSDCVASRLGLPVSTIDKIFITAQAVIGRLKTRRIQTRTTTVHRSIRDAVERPVPLTELGIDFTRLRQSRWIQVWQHVEALSEEEVSLLVEAWSGSFDRSYLDLSNDHDRRVIFQFLRSCGVPSNHLAIAIACADPCNQTGEEQSVEASIVRFFERWFGVPPMIDRKMARRSRPAIYLMWSGVSLMEGGTPASAALSLAGFHAMMLGNAVFLEIHKTTRGFSFKEAD